MKHTEIINFLKVCRKAEIVPFIWGKHGIGKSQLVEQYAKANNLQMIDLRLSLMEPGDLVGMPIIEKDYTVFKKPTWFPREKTKGILFLDELNRANDDILQAIFQLVLDKRINDHILPKDWQIVCAGNYGDDFQITELDPALMDRFCHLKIDVDMDEWAVWAVNKNLDSKMIGVIKEHNILNAKDPFVLDQLPISTTPRSWEMLNRILKATTDTALVSQACMGLLTLPDASLFMNAYYDDKFINLTAEDVIQFDKSKIKKALKNERVMQLCSSLNSDLIEAIQNTNLEAKQCTNIIKFMNMAPNDCAFAFMASLKGIEEFNGFCNKVPEKQMDKLYNKLVSENENK